MMARYERPFFGLLLAALVAGALFHGIARAGIDPPPPPPPILADTLALDRVTFGMAHCDTCPPIPCPGEPVLVQVSGRMRACTVFRGIHELPVASPFPVYQAEFINQRCFGPCPDATLEWHGSFMLPPTGPGTHSFDFRYVLRACEDTNTVQWSNQRFLSYNVPEFCPVPPPPPVPVDSLVRSFASYRIVPEHPCPGDSVSLEWAERGCPPCVALEGLSQTRVRGFVGSMNWRPGCLEFACVSDTLRLGLGRFVAGQFQLRVLTDVHVLDTVKPDSVITFETMVNFEVSRTCPPPDEGCFHAELPWPTTVPPGPALTLRPGERGELGLSVLNGLHRAVVAGLEGQLAIAPPMRILELRPAHPESGARVVWQRSGEQTRFVMFGDGRAIVPEGLSELLRVVVAADSGAAVTGGCSVLDGQITLVSDRDGNLLPICPVPASLTLGMRVCLDTTSSSCDANGDGRLDVRDLVRMTRCLPNILVDPIPSARCHDCDHDSLFTFRDLVCCAHEILRGPGVPHDSLTASGDVSVSLEPLGDDGATRTFRVRVLGAGGLDGAFLRLRYPAERWSAALAPVSGAQDGPGGDPDWLPLSDAGQAGVLHLGGVRLGATSQAPLEYVVTLTAIAPAAGDELQVEDAELVALDGRPLIPVAPLPGSSLAPVALPTDVALSRAAPNPFAGRTRFTVSLPRAANVELTVHDLAGRRVATLTNGAWSAGRHDFEWSAAGAPDGLYFARLKVEGRVWTTRAVLRAGAR